MPLAGSQQDDTATLMAAGIIAYMTETLAHEAIGHGGVCLAYGLRFTLLAPLWMRCSETPLPMVAAGPAANALAAFCCAATLFQAPIRRPLTALLLWLGFAFNSLVFCGYLAVGALTGFGDWPAVFASVHPALAWRIPAALIAIAGYYACLRMAAYLFTRMAGASPAARQTLFRRALWPACAAAAVACLAEIIGGRAQPMPLLLALGCTVGVGYSLTSMDSVVATPNPAQHDLGPIPRAWWLIALAAGAGTAFILVIGPGFSVMR